MGMKNKVLEGKDIEQDSKISAVGSIAKGVAFTIIPLGAISAMAYANYKLIPPLYNKVLLTQWAHTVNNTKISGLVFADMAVVVGGVYLASLGVAAIKDGLNTLRR
jgi:hypothetical protein